MSRWYGRTVFFWEEAPFFRLLLPLAAGIMWYDHCWEQPYPQPVVTVLTIASCCLLGLTALYRKDTIVKRLLLQTALCSFLAFAGWQLSFYQDIRNHPRWMGHHTGHCDAFAVIITEPPEVRAKTWKLTVAVTYALYPEVIQPAAGYAFVYVYKNNQEEHPFRQGDLLLVPNKWQPAGGSGNPFAFDYAAFSRRKGIPYLLFAAMDDIQLVRPANPRIPWLKQIRNHSMAQLTYFVQDTATLGLLQAMLLGDETNFDPEQRQLYADTGIIHVVAISGGHVAFLFALVSACFAVIRHKRYQFIRYIAAIPLVWLYVLIAGAPSPAVRAALMFTLLATGYTLEKESHPLNQLFVTAFLILLFYPFWLFSIGFQLSFIAVLSLILFYGRINGAWRPRHLLLRKIWPVASMSLAAEVLVAPVVVYYFHTFPVTFLPANIIAWMLMGIVMVGGIIIILAGHIAGLGMLTAWLVVQTVTIFDQALTVLNRLHPESFSRLYLSDFDLAIVFVCIAGMAIWILRCQKTGLFVSLIALVCLAGSACFSAWHRQRQHTLIVYNAGKHTCVEELYGGTGRLLYVDTIGEGAYRSLRDIRREVHIHTGTRPQKDQVATDQELFIFGGSKILLLNRHFPVDTGIVFPVDYLILAYPVNDWNGVQLQQMFVFKTLVITGNQRESSLWQWQDSCRKYAVPLHCTRYDGAFVIGE